MMDQKNKNNLHIPQHFNGTIKLMMSSKQNVSMEEGRKEEGGMI